MADEATRLKAVSDELEATYQLLRKAAANISGLVQLGKATCAEIKTYNLFALAIYNVQRGMLDTLRASGQSDAPVLPTAPTLFAWKGIQGIDALQMNCEQGTQDLSGASFPAMLKKTLQGPTPTTPFLSTNEIDIVTQDQWAFSPDDAPSYKALLDLQAQREAESRQNGLGLSVGVIILIAGLVISVIAGAVIAIMHYLETSAVQEANVKQTRLQAEAYANYTAARLSCYAQCTQSGKSSEQCIQLCQSLVAEPKIKLPGQDSKWTFLQWTGFTVLVGGGAIVAWRLWQRHRAGKPILALPEVAA